MSKITRTTLEKLRETSPGEAKGASWHGTALLIEAVIILAIVALCMTVFAQVFAYSYIANSDNAHRAQAITLATSKAEEFASNPSQTPSGTQDEEGYTTECVVTPKQTAEGTLYEADITVSFQGEVVYELSTSRYTSANEDGRRS